MSNPGSSDGGTLTPSSGEGSIARRTRDDSGHDVARLIVLERECASNEGAQRSMLGRAARRLERAAAHVRDEAGFGEEGGGNVAGARRESMVSAWSGAFIV